MRVPFRQGIVVAPANFLVLSNNRVNLEVPANGLATAITLTFADGTTDYIVTEPTSVINAWAGPFIAGTTYWLYWDINVQTGALTRGYTLLEPIEGNTAPLAPLVDQHWFDTSTSKMYVYNTAVSRWMHVIRVFAASLFNGVVFVSMSINSPVFTGTQAGISYSYDVDAGSIVFDGQGFAIRKQNGEFFTTSDVAVTGIGSNTRVKLESIVLSAQVTEPIPAFSMVRLVDFDKIALATNLLASAGVYGIVETDANIGDVVNIIREGIIVNNNWHWVAAGASINAPLYVNSSGTLTIVPQAASPSVGIVLSDNSILLTSTIVDAVTQIDSVVTINDPAQGIKFNGNTGSTSSTFNVQLSDELAAIQNLSTTGIVRRDGANTWSTGNISLTTDVNDILPTANGGTGTSGLVGYIYSMFPGQALMGVPTIPGVDIFGDIFGKASNVTGTVAIENGGTGAINRRDAINALLPAQTLATNNQALVSTGFDAEWRDITGGTVTSIGLALTTSGLAVTNTPITVSGDIQLGLTGNVLGLATLPTAGLVSADLTGTVRSHAIVSAPGRLDITNGSGGAAGDIIIDLVPLIAPGTYVTITADTYGRVTGGGTSLDWNSITNIPHTLSEHSITNAYTKTEIDTKTWDWSLITSTPITLAGYGITNAYTKTEIDTKTWDWSTISNTPDTLAGYGITNGVVNASGVTSLALDATINRPPGGVFGRLYVDTTTNVFSYDNGTSWIPIGNAGTVTSFQIASNTAGITVTNGSVTTSGTVTLDFGGNVRSVDQLASIGFTTRDNTGVWSARTILGTVGSISVLNGDGVGGNPTIDLTTVGAPGTYYQVTVDSKGRVTSGLPTVTWADISGTPTTLAGYGITDGVNTTMLGAPNGVATLDVTGKIPTNQLPAIAITDTFVVTSQAAMLALTAQTGDIAIRSDEGKTYILQGVSPSFLSNWVALTTPTSGTSGVISVDATSTTSDLVITGGPIIDTGTLSFSLSGNLAAVAGVSGSGIIRKSGVNWSATTVNLSTEVSNVLPVSNGGTGVNSLTGYVFGTGSTALSASPTIPGTAVTGDISGNAANVTGTVAIPNGGTGATTQIGAMLNILPPQLNGVLASNGGIVSWSTSIPGTYITGTVPSAATAGNAINLDNIPASNYSLADGTNASGTWGIDISGDALSLNGLASSAFALADGTNASGTWSIDISGNALTATDVTGTVAITNGGTGATTQTGAMLNILPTLIPGVLSSDGSAVVWSSAIPGSFITGTVPLATAAVSATTATAADNVTGVVEITHGGTGATTASQALTNLGAVALVDAAIRVAVPTAITDPGNLGEWAADATHFYWYTGTGWLRVAGAIW